MLTWTAVEPAEKGMTCAKKFWLMALGMGTPRDSDADGVDGFAFPRERRRYSRGGLLIVLELPCEKMVS